jgi:heat shock protein HtpX
MWFNQVKTAVLLATLSGLLMLIGNYLGGVNGLLIFTLISVVINAFSFYFAEQMVLKIYNAVPLDHAKYGWIYEIVQELVDKEQMPMPKMWLVPLSMANAFATGRNPEHASVALTQGIIGLLTPEELRGVLAHELSHIKNRDILIGTVAATLATAIGFMANLMQNMAFFGGMSRDKDQRVNPLSLLVIAILMPLAATLIQLAISRSREYLADESGAELSHDPLALASALEKLQFSGKRSNFGAHDTQHASTAHLFIVNPFLGGSLSTLFATHPPMEKRVARLRHIFEKMRHIR